VAAGFMLVETEGASAEVSSRLAARLAAGGDRVFYLDGENGFRVYAAAEEAEAQGTPALDALERIQVARAFTCFQMVELLRNAARKLVAEDIAILAGPCTAFADENVTDREVSFFLGKALDSAKQLTSRTTLTFQSGEDLGRRPWLLSRLRAAAAACVVLPQTANVGELLRKLNKRRILKWGAPHPLSAE